MLAFDIKCAIFVIAVIVFFTQIGFVVRGTGRSMSPTLSNNSVVFGLRTFSTFDRNDVIATGAIKDWPVDFGVVKRVIGVPGDIVVVDGINLYVNGELVDNSIMKPGYPYKEYTLAEDQYFIVGDNRAGSLDSRAKGPIQKSDIKAKILYWINF